MKRTKKPVAVEHVHYDKEGRPGLFEIHGYLTGQRSYPAAPHFFQGRSVDKKDGICFRADQGYCRLCLAGVQHQVQYLHTEKQALPLKSGRYIKSFKGVVAKPFEMIELGRVLHEVLEGPDDG